MAHRQGRQVAEEFDKAIKSSNEQQRQTAPTGGKFMKTRYRAIRTLGIAAAALAASAAVGLAQGWQPTEQLVLVSQSSPGTGNDLLLRELAAIWTKNGMVPVAVTNENVTGAQGENARRYVSSENAGNPHMLYAYTPGTLNQTILSKSEYTWDKFTSIANLVADPSVVVVNAESSFNSVADLVAAAKATPGSVIQGGGPYGGSASITGRLISDVSGVELPYTPFKGGGEAVTALLGNHIQFIIENTAEVRSYVEAGQMRVIAVSEKLDAFPDVPTLKESGFDVELGEFRIIVAPPGIPAEAAQYYTDLLKQTMETPEWKEYETKNSLVPDWMDGPEALAYLTELAASYREIDEKMGLLK
jgi:putative tricarboxylic transport membrane protein